MQKSAYTYPIYSRLFIGVLILLSMSCVLIALTYSPFSFAIVGSSSMSPSLSTGDVFLWKSADITDITIGDIVVYKSSTYWADEKIIVHRVIDITTDSTGKTLLTMKGDATAYVDEQSSMLPEPYVEYNQVLGKVACIGEQPVKIPFIGMIGLSIK